MRSADSPDEARDGNASTGKKNKVLFVVTVSWFFVSHRLKLAAAIREAGFDVHVATRVDSEGDAERIAEHGVKLHSLEIGRGDSSLVYDLKSCISLWRLYRELEPDIIHHVAMKPVIFGGIIARLMRRPSVVQAIPGLGHVYSASSGLLNALRRRVLTGLLRLACGGRNTAVIVQNRENLDTLAESAVVTSDRAWLIRGAGVDTRQIDVEVEPDAPVRVVLASRMLKEKGVAEFVAAATELSASRTDVEFLLAGEPDSASPGSIPIEQLRRWHQDGVVRYLGFEKDVIGLFASSHIVCLPTYYGEGVPKVLIEAAACGRPIVTTDQPGCRDIVRNGINGLLVPSPDVKALVTALGRLIEDSGLRRRFGDAGREIAEAEFDFGIVLTQTMQVYRTLLSSSHREVS